MLFSNRIRVSISPQNRNNPQSTRENQTKEERKDAVVTHHECYATF